MEFMGKIKILLTGGGTAGHLMPVIAVVNELRAKSKELGFRIEFLHIGSNEKMEREIIEDAGIKYKSIPAGKLRRYISLKNLIDIFKIPIGVLEAYFIVRKFNPDVVFGKGGYASVPAVIASAWLKKPIVIHDSDATPGLANRKMARHAAKVAVSFENAKKFFSNEKVVLTGNPIIENFLNGNKKRARTLYKLRDDKPVIFVTGGSFGARTINRTLVLSCGNLRNFQIIHQCGKGKNLESTLDLFEKTHGVSLLSKKVANSSFEMYSYKNYRLVPFLKKEMADAYACAELVVSRAGASNISEIAALGKPSILVPLPLSASRGEQIVNARIFENAGASVVIQNDDFTHENLVSVVRDLFSNGEKLSQMGEKARKLARPDAAAKIADAILSLLI